ncbi:CCHC-type integrase [Gossypium australe]|uniref:CCHC-type integrase n=1 Tax=Gossypium australe TaxID=47621 RepID=A0A5B6WF71_9ROSI|nr:CCHC-type integrase [Gossypium australe]
MMLIEALILNLFEFRKDFMVYSDADDKVIAYASRQLKAHEHNNLMHNLELIVMVFALKILRH